MSFGLLCQVSITATAEAAKGVSETLMTDEVHHTDMHNAEASPQLPMEASDLPAELDINAHAPTAVSREQLAGANDACKTSMLCVKALAGQACLQCRYKETLLLTL